MKKYLVIIVAFLVYASGLIIDHYKVYSYFKDSLVTTFIAGVLLFMGFVYLTLSNIGLKTESENRLISWCIYITSIYPFISFGPTLLNVVFEFQINMGILTPGLFSLFFFLILQLLPLGMLFICLLYTSPSPRDRTRSRMPSSA